MAWMNGTFLRKPKSKSDSYLGAKRNLSPKRGGKQGELACRNPTLAKCGGEAQHLEKLEV
jgi:hypothetical protein